MSMMITITMISMIMMIIIMMMMMMVYIRGPICKEPVVSEWALGKLVPRANCLGPNSPGPNLPKTDHDKEEQKVGCTDYTGRKMKMLQPQKNPKITCNVLKLVTICVSHFAFLLPPTGSPLTNLGQFLPLFLKNEIGALHCIVVPQQCQQAISNLKSAASSLRPKLA